MSLFKSYTSLPPRTRLVFGLSMITCGALWAYLPDKIERRLGVEETDAERREVQGLLPTVSVVNRAEVEARRKERE